MNNYCESFAAAVEVRRGADMTILDPAADAAAVAAGGSKRAGQRTGYWESAARMRTIGRRADLDIEMGRR